MISYNQVIALFQNIATAHEQVHSFGVGEAWMVDARPEDQQLMPKVWLIPGQLDVQEYIMRYNLTLLCFDLVQKDETNMEEVLSDTQLILLDIVKVLRAYPNSWFQIVDEPRLNPFVERFQEDVSGWRMDLVLQVDFNSSECDMPMDAFVIPGQGEADPGGGGGTAGCCSGNPNEVAVYGPDGLLTSIPGGGSGQVLTANGSGGYQFTTVSGGNALQIGNLVVSGTPTEVLYIDNAGNLFSDSNFTRDSVTNETRVLSTALQAGFESGMSATIGSPEVVLQHYDAANTVGSRLVMDSVSTNLISLDLATLSLAVATTDVSLGRVGISFVSGTLNQAGDVGVAIGSAAFVRYSFNDSSNLANTLIVNNTSMKFASDLNNVGDNFLDINVANGTYEIGDKNGSNAGMGIKADDGNRLVELGNIYGVGNNTTLKVFDQAQAVAGYTNTNDLLLVTGDPNNVKFTAFGYKAGNVSISGLGNVLVGPEAGHALNSGFNNTLIGYGAASTITTQNSNTIVGRGATVNGSTNTGIGDGISINASGSVAIGAGVLTNNTGQFVTGSDTAPMTEYVFHRGLQSSSAHVDNLVCRKSHAVGTDRQTTQWNWSTGNSTGDKDGGSFVWEIAKGSTSGSTPNIAQEVFRLNQSEAYFSQRVWTQLGAAVAANDLVCPAGANGASNTFTVSGNTTINGIDAQWASAQQIIIVFTGSPVLKHDTACGLAFRRMKLAGSTDFSAAPDATIGFVFDGTYFQETFRKYP